MQVAASMRRFGMIQPIVIDADHEVVCGVARLMAARDMGLACVPVIRIDHLSDLELRAFRPADNKIAEGGSWINEALAIELPALMLGEFEIEVSGFDTVVLGVLNNVVPFTPFAFGETRISSGLASILNATTPLFGVGVAHLFTADERLNWGKAMGLCGVAVLVGPDALRHAGSGDLLGEAACPGAALTYAFASLYGHRFRGLRPLKVATGQVTGSMLVLIPLSALVDRPWTLPMPGAHVWLSFAGIALFSTAFAYVLYFRILATAGATNLLFVTFLLPVSALGLGVTFLGETVTARVLAGMALIGLGLVALDGRLARRLRGGE